MAENGHATGMELPSIPMESVDFIVGGRKITIPALSMWDLERAREPILSLAPDLWWADYAKGIFKIIAVLVPGEDEETLKRACSVAEGRALSVSWAELLEKSGWSLGETGAAGEASPGTGTSTSSSPNSEPAESAAGIPIV